MKDKVKDFITKKIEAGLYPGAQVIVTKKSETLLDLSLGSMVKGSVKPGDKVTGNTLFNIESITKVMVTLPLVFKLVEKGILNLDDRLVKYIPEFGTDIQKRNVTIRNLLNFSGGIPLEDPEGCEEAACNKDLNKAWDLHYSQELASPPGSNILYSDVSCRILGKMLERVLGDSLAVAAKEWIFDPLGMKNTMFNPPKRENCADVGVSDAGRHLRGEVCQDLEHYLGEVLGSDGLFSTAADMAVFSHMILNKGVYKNKRILGRSAIKKMTEGITNRDLYEIPNSGLHYIVSGPKTWFWEYASSPFSFFGNLVSEKAIGKMGGAGTFLLIDPELDLTVVYLTNYGQPERSLIGEEGWNKFFEDINVMGLCNLIVGNLD
jgi:CubicO group peptidase (beta-lactamase class C family)